MWQEPSPTVISAILAQQFPALGVRTVLPVDEGGDFATVLVTASARGPRPSAVFRFPCSDEKAKRLEREVALMRLLRSRLPVAVPEYQWLGQPDPLFRFPFGGYALLPGVSGERLRPAVEAWGALAHQWAAILAGLASVLAMDLDALGVPISPATDLAELRERACSWPPLHTEAVEAELPTLARPYLRGDDTTPKATPGAPVLAHADLKGEHLLIDSGTQLVSAILDWTDAYRAEPATDLAGLMIWLGPGFVSLVWDELREMPGWGVAGTFERAVALARYGTLDRLGERLAGESDSPLPLLWTQLRWAFAEA